MYKRQEYDFLEGVFIPTYCDTMKAILANWPIAVPNCKAIPFVYPQNRESSGSEAFLVAQFKGFKKDLENLLSYEIKDEDIETAFVIYEEYRAAMREFVELVNDYPQTLDPVSYTHLDVYKRQYRIPNGRKTLLPERLFRDAGLMPLRAQVRLILTSLQQQRNARAHFPVSYTHLDVYKRQP